MEGGDVMPLSELRELIDDTIKTAKREAYREALIDVVESLSETLTTEQLIRIDELRRNVGTE